MFNITMLPSAGWLAMEYARTMGSSLTILRSHKTKLVPFALEGVRVLVVIRVGRDVHVLVLHHRCRNIDLDVPTGFEVERLAVRQAHHELFDEGGHVVVRYHFAFPLLDAKDFFGDLDLHVLFDLDLATQAPVVGDFLAREVGLLSGKNGPSPCRHLATALNTGSATAACGRKEDARVAQGGQQGAAAFDFEGLFSVDTKLELAAWGKARLGKKQQADQQKNDSQEETMVRRIVVLMTSSFRFQCP